MSHYLFDNAREQTGQRFASLEALYDPWTMRSRHFYPNIHQAKNRRA
jgi:hypothetical protein